MTLPANFWESFTRVHWEKGPTVFNESIISEAELFESILKASKEYLQDPGDESGFASPEGRISLSFMVDNCRVLANTHPLLPVATDGDVFGYIRRVSDHLSGREFCMNLVDLERWNNKLWLRLRDFFTGLYGQVGITACAVHPAVFLGNYSRTPFGVHKDQAGVFSFVIAGRKRFRVWPFKAFADHPMVRPRIAQYAGSDIDFIGRQTQIGLDELDYSQYLEGSTVLEANAGEVIYWPAGYWHIAEADGRVASASLNVGYFFPHQECFEQGLRLLNREIERRLGEQRFVEQMAYPGGDLTATAAKMPRVLNLLGPAAEVALAESELTVLLKVYWAEHVSRAGMKTNYPFSKTSMTRSSVVKADAKYPILTVDDDKRRRTTYVANGYSLTLPAHPGLHALVSELNTGRPLVVNDLVDRYSGDGNLGDRVASISPDDTHRMLEMFGSWGALVVRQ